jgi:hypothetical protein
MAMDRIDSTKRARLTLTIPQSAALCLASRLGSLVMLLAMRRALSSVSTQQLGPEFI